MSRRFDSLAQPGVVYFSNYGAADEYRNNTPDTVVQSTNEMWSRRGYAYVVKPLGMRVRSNADPVYTVEAGRLICRYGQPYLSIQKRDATPCDADEVTKFICQMLNEKKWAGVSATEQGESDSARRAQARGDS